MNPLDPFISAFSKRHTTPSPFYRTKTFQSTDLFLKEDKRPKSIG